MCLCQPCELCGPGLTSKQVVMSEITLTEVKPLFTYLKLPQEAIFHREAQSSNWRGTTTTRIEGVLNESNHSQIPRFEGIILKLTSLISLPWLSPSLHSRQQS